MEIWMIYAIVASICNGLYGFAQKMKAEYPGQSDTGFILYTYIILLITGVIGVGINGEISDLYNSTTMIYAFGVMFLYTIIVKTRLLSLRHLSSSTYFINYRIFSSIWLLFIGIFLFSETISGKELIGVGIGFLVFYFLLEKKHETESKKDIRKGFLYLVIGSFCIAILQGMSKDFALSGLNLYSYALYCGIFGIVFLLILKKGETFSQIIKIQNTAHIVFLIVSGLLFTIATLTNNLAFTSGDLAIVYKIISYSLFIPIILSIIIYKEPVTQKKLFAFGLTIISIFLFI